MKFLKVGLGLPDFKESQKQQRQYAKHLLNLSKKVIEACDGNESEGKKEFERRFKVVISDDFKAKNCNSIRYLYREIKSVPAAKSILANRGKKVEPTEIEVL